MSARLAIALSKLNDLIVEDSIPSPDVDALYNVCIFIHCLHVITIHVCIIIRCLHVITIHVCITVCCVHVITLRVCTIMLDV